MGLFSKTKEAAPATFEAGDKVLYKGDGDQWLEGVVHGVRSFEDNKSKRLNVTYLVDTGEDLQSYEILTAKGKPNITVRQPEQVEVTPDNIKEA